ncbi:hypothetical protein BE21_39000 [Sorangium cellulosum]|uniref:Lipoprotein n=1 Tax=Sorangium cellulosum TaxID=56 RepID=A0A150TM87_SORCE|nr:hypothetical protein BE21_39000 [Sorangium cellulosum]
MRPAGPVRVLAMAAALLGAAGCDVVFGIRPGQPRPSSDGSTGGHGGHGGTGDGGTGGQGELEVEGPIASDTTWTRGRPPRLRAPVVVEAGATLTIEPGTTVVADAGSLLAVKPGARLVANGTLEAPIVLTSSRSPRSPGDWGGLVLCGKARINAPEGKAMSDSSPRSLGLLCGGEDDDDDSGQLSYLRIEFAGEDVREGEPSAGLELIGVGRRTSIHHVQMVNIMDDGVYVLGGTAEMKHVLVVGGDDDSFDWDRGWRGKGQFLAGLRTAVDFHGSGIEADDRGEEPEFDPALASSPTLYNVTLLGNPDASSDGAGVKLESGTRGQLHNVLVADFSNVGIKVVDQETAANVGSGALDMTHSILGNETDFAEVSADPEEYDYDEEAWIMSEDPDRSNQRVPSSDLGIRSRWWLDLDLSLEPGSPGLQGAAPPPEGDPFFDATASFIGACGETCRDFEGWTAFPIE